MKKVVLLFAVAIAAVSVKAQDKGAAGFQFGAGVKAALPIGDLADFSSFGIGAEVQGEYAFTSNLSAVASAGYTHFLGKDGADGSGYIPVLVGARYYAMESFFLGAKAGLSFSTKSGGGSIFTYVPQVGYNASNYQLFLSYDGMTKNSINLGSVSLTGIYKFGGKK